VIVSVLKKTDNKEVLFNEQERLSLVSKSVQKFSNVEVDIFDGLLIKYAELKDASAVIRGLRAISDFEYEFQMALMNRNLNEKVRTLFLMPHQKYIHISSSLVKEVAQLKGDISQYVPEHVNQLLKDIYN